MNKPSQYLLNLAHEVAEAYAAVPGMRAIMVTGSAAEDEADLFSDIDMTAYYDVFPAEDDLRAAREKVGGGERVWLLGDPAEGAIAEAFMWRGIECQIGHTTIENWERDIDQVLVGLDVDSPLQKAMSGTLVCVPFYGAEWIQRWQQRLRAYPDALAQAMVKKYLSFPALWLIHDRLAIRDATIWHYQALVEIAQNVLGTLAGLNRQYFTTFQFKRMRRFIDTLDVKPDALYARLEAMFVADRKTADEMAEALVRDTVALVDAHMPEVDTSAAKRRLGQRAQPWTIA